MKMRAESFGNQHRHSMDHPSNQNQDQVDPSVVKIGVLGLIFGNVVYAAVIYCAALVLEWQEVISFKIEWPAALALAGIYIVARSIDRVFFRR